jgi:predicted unusual protein kinase regulating ubiquinone biosynthesis (AarF/ABC1/UbiB family)
LGLVKKIVQPGALARGFRLGKLGLTLSGSYLGYQAQNLWLGEEQRAERQQRFQQKASRRVRQELQSLKGAAMKLGQIFSLQTHALSDEALKELATLQMHAPAMHPTLARAQFKSSMGKYPEEVLREFDPEPSAAASLGQVHRAVTKSGEKVAVKIQYPAIRASIENDFKLLRSATFPARLTGHTPTALFDEIERGFLEETDYIHEGKNLEFFGAGLGSFSYLTIPRVYWDVTAQRVLTMSFIEGLPMAAFLKTKPSQSIRDSIGSHLVELYYFQLHKLKAIHADHHPGNYLFQEDGRIGLIDFGCVKRLTFDVTDLINCVVARTWRDSESAARHVLGLVFGRNVPYQRARKALPMLEEMAEILHPERDQTVVNFGNAKMLEALGAGMGLVMRDKLVNPEFAFISRADLGLYSLLHQLRAHVNCKALWRKISAG